MPETALLAGIPVTVWAQWAVVILFMVFVLVLLRYAGTIFNRIMLEFEKYRAEKNKEIIDQRDWQEEQGKKRDAVSNAQLKSIIEMTNRSNNFMAGLQEDQQKSFSVLTQNIQAVNQSIQLTDKKIDLLLTDLKAHDQSSKQAIAEVRQENNALHPPGPPTTKRNRT
jgi:hypothetical protein